LSPILTRAILADGSIVNQPSEKTSR